MNLIEFKEWLTKRYPDNLPTVQSRISNLKKVVNHYGNLNRHYNNDKCKTIIEALTYSSDAEKEGVAPNHPIPINGNIRTGSASLKQSVGLFVKFKQESEDELFETGNSSKKSDLFENDDFDKLFKDL